MTESRWRPIVCGPDPERHLEAIETYRAMGFDHVYFHQVGPDQRGSFASVRFCRRRLRRRQHVDTEDTMPERPATSRASGSGGIVRRE
jgi:hypothetical protein